MLFFWESVCIFEKLKNWTLHHLLISPCISPKRRKKLIALVLFFHRQQYSIGSLLGYEVMNRNSAKFPY